VVFKQVVVEIKERKGTLTFTTNTQEELKNFNLNRSYDWQRYWDFLQDILPFLLDLPKLHQ
jgi:hypothetical protein